MGSTAKSSGGGMAPLRYIPQTYNHADSQSSALRLVLTLNPHWEGPGNKVEFVRFTDGITNTLLKIVNRKAGLTEEQIDNEAVLMRAYGNHTEILIDRERETQSHALLASRGLAPPLLARFQNGLLYRFIRGRVATPPDLITPPIWRGVARRLGQWHAVLPISESISTTDPTGVMAPQHCQNTEQEVDFELIEPRQPGPSLWTVLQKWILALPATTQTQRDRRLSLQKELQWIVNELDDGTGIGDNGLVFAHCDLLSGNVVVMPPSQDESTCSTDQTASTTTPATVNFIDYEYATPSPAAFDIANHFAEWGGFDCDYNMMPTRMVRKDFLTEYVKSYCGHRTPADDKTTATETEDLVERLFADVDRFRGIPGFYWGLWALIQAQISQIDFDYASYAEVRLGEYFAWRRELDGTRAKVGEEMPLRERRWAQEA